AKLGEVMHESARKAELAEKISGSSSNSLPPELVQDMMIMALDKYKAASTLGDETKIPSTNSGGMTRLMN
ncbi:MAG: hypothetical protein PHX43_02600, partial [Alphaproteobacteria bacterium]|nr:hypothetical protein [Alphaproteobacteria bacterium]